MAKADIVQLQENGEPKYVATHANAVEGLSEFIQRDYDARGSEEKIYVSDSRGDNNLADGSEDRPYRTIQAAVNSIPLISSTFFYIIVENGVYMEDVLVERVKSGTLEIRSTNYETVNASEESTGVLVRSISFIDCNTYCAVRGITQTDPQNSRENVFIRFAGCIYGAVENCRIVVNTKSIEGYKGIQWGHCISGNTYNSLVSNQNIAFSVIFGGMTRVSYSTSGTGNNTVNNIEGAIMFTSNSDTVTGNKIDDLNYGGQVFRG